MAGSSRWAASRHLVVRLLAVALLLALSGCTPGGDAGDGTRAQTTEAAPVGATATTTQAAELRAALTHHLTVRVHLVL